MVGPQAQRHRAVSGSQERGFTYLAILFAVAVLGIGLGAVSDVWVTASQRDKEAELLQVGNEIREAIGRYYDASPPGAKRFPGRLEDLLKDNRFPMVRRHLRKIYQDPITNSTTWGLIVSPAGGIIGVHSLSDQAPLKTTGFALTDIAFDGKGKYSDWTFTFVPQQAESNRDRQGGTVELIRPRSRIRSSSSQAAPLRRRISPSVRS